MTAKTKAAEAPEKTDNPPPIIDKRVLELTPPDGGLAVDIPNDVLVRAGVLGTEYPWAKGYSPEVRAVPYARIDPSPLNHRTIFAKIDELGVSIQQEGLRNPLVGRPSPRDPTRIELVTGERRLRAMGRLNQLAGEHGLPVDPWTAVPMRIRQFTDAEVIIEQAIENLDREDPHPLEEAMIYEKLCAPLHEGGQGFTVEQAAAKTRRDPAHIVGSMKLLALRQKSRAAFLRGEIVLGHALILARIPKPDKGPDLQDEMLKDMLIGRDGRGRPEDAAVMTVAAAKRHAMQHYMLPIAKAPFDVADATLNPARGACGGCEFNTDKQPLLFADVGRSEGLCTKPDCWEMKMDAAWVREKEAAKKKGQKVLTDAETKAVFPYDHDYVDRQKGYVKLDETSYEAGGGATYRALIKKARIEMPPIVLARTPQKQRVELIASADAERIVRTIKKERAETSGPTPDQKHRKAQAEAKERSRIANLVFQAIVAAIVVAFEKVKDPTDAVLRMLARALVRSVWADTQENVVKRRDLLPKPEPAPAGTKAAKKKPARGNPLVAKHHNNEALLLAHVDELKGKGALLAFVLEVTLTRAGGGRPLDDTPEIAEVAAQLKVDAKAIRTTIETAEKKGKTKPAKPKAAAKKPASKAAKKGERSGKASGKPKAASKTEDDDEAPPREKRRGGPAKCPRPCTECKTGDHHFSEAMVESDETSPEHEAVQAGVQFWYECKHCDAWLEWDPDEEDAEPGEGKCRVCTCTDETPCDVDGGECTWNDAEATLCSACAELLNKTTDFCEPPDVPERGRKGHPLPRSALIEILRKEAFAMWGGELYEDLSDADRKSAAKAYPDERIAAVIDEAVQLGRIIDDGSGYLLGPSAPPRIKDLFGKPQIPPGASIAGAAIPPTATTAQDVADAINAQSPTHTAEVVKGPVTSADGAPMAQAALALKERERGTASAPVKPPFDVSPTALKCAACKIDPAAPSDDVCAKDRTLIEEVLRVIWERAFMEETPLTEEQLAGDHRLDAGPMRIRGAIAYLRGKELLGLVERQRLVLTPLPPPPPRTKADRDLDLRVLQLLGKSHDSAFKIVRAVSTGSTIAGPTHEQVMGSLRYITASDGRFPVMDVALAGVALENTLAETKATPGSREERLDRALRAELMTGDKDMEVLVHVGARALGYVTAAPAILPVEIRASCRRIMADRRAAAEQETYRLVQPKDPVIPASAGAPACFVCMGELPVKNIGLQRCEACAALCTRIVACVRDNPRRWSKNGLSPEAFADVEADGMTPEPSAIVKPHLLRRAIEHLVERGEIDTSKGGMCVPGAEETKRPHGDGATAWRDLLGPSKVERLVHQRLHASGHHRVLIIGAHTYRTAAILNHLTAPRSQPIFVDERDEKTRAEAIPPLGVEQLPKGESPSFDRVLVLPSPHGDPAAYDEVATIENAYLRLAMETGRIAAVVTKETAADPRIKALLIEHNGVAEELQDDERHLGMGLMLVAIYRVTVAGGHVAQTSRRAKLTGLAGGKAAAPAAPKPARASRAKPAAKGAGRAKPAAPSGPPGAA